MPRPYKLGIRQASVERTATAIIGAARRLLAHSPPSEVSIGAIAREAGVSRLTVYQRFGSRQGLLTALAVPLPSSVPEEQLSGDPREALRRHLLGACERWATAPAMFRHLQPVTVPDAGVERTLAERLLNVDALRPGCSVREAEDVITALGSFAVFDRLHRDGRRSATAVADVLTRLAAAILA